MDADGFHAAFAGLATWLASEPASSHQDDLMELRRTWRTVPGLNVSVELLATAGQLRSPHSKQHEQWLWGTLRYELGSQVLRSPIRGGRRREWWLHLPAPTEQWANANTRHASMWGNISHAKRWRQHTADLAWVKVQQGHLPQHLEYATVRCWVQPSDYRKRDLDNWAEICKRIIDALGPPTTRKDKDGLPRTDPGVSVLRGDDLTHLSGPHRHWWHTAAPRRKGDPAGTIHIKIIDLSE